MVKKKTITIDDKWLNLDELKLPGGVTVQEIEKILVVKPIKISLEVVLPEGVDPSGFDYDKSSDVKKFRTLVESKAATALAEIAGEDQPQEGQKTLEGINSYLEKAVKAFRVQLREAIAKSVGGDCKANDLMTAGSINFQEIEFQFGVGDASEEKFPLLDLTKAFKRLKKDQQLGVAWKANKIVISVRFRKPFRDAELKELRELLPEGASRGAKMLAGEFHALAKGKVELRFQPNASPPHEILLRKAFKKQTGQAVHTTLMELNPSAASDDDADDDGEQASGSKKPRKSRRSGTK